MNLKADVKEKVSKFWNVLKILSFIILVFLAFDYFNLIVYSINENDIVVKLFNQIYINIGYILK